MCHPITISNGRAASSIKEQRSPGTPTPPSAPCRHRSTTTHAPRRQRGQRPPSRRGKKKSRILSKATLRGHKPNRLSREEGNFKDESRKEREKIFLQEHEHRTSTRTTPPPAEIKIENAKPPTHRTNATRSRRAPLLILRGQRHAARRTPF